MLKKLPLLQLISGFKHSIRYQPKAINHTSITLTTCIHFKCSMAKEFNISHFLSDDSIKGQSLKEYDDKTIISQLEVLVNNDLSADKTLLMIDPMALNTLEQRV